MSETTLVEDSANVKTTTNATEEDSSAAGTVVRVYNKFLVDMMLNLKGGHGGVLKKALKVAGHKAIDPASPKYVQHAAGCLPRAALVRSREDDSDVLQDEAVLAFEPLKGVPMRVVSEAVVDDVVAASSARCYLYIVAVLSVTYAECTSGGVDGNGALVRSVLDAISRVQNGGADHVVVDGIMDDDIVSLLTRLEEVTEEAAGEVTGEQSPETDGTDGGGSGLESLLKSLENSKIADLAKEITQDIQVSDFASEAANLENPAEFLNFANLGDSNSLLGSIVSKVGSKIQGKLSSGELRQDELLSEAMSLLKALDTNKDAFAAHPLMGDLMKAASGNLPGGLGGLLGAVGGAQNPRVITHKARERLRQKLERQRAATNEHTSDKKRT